MRIFNGHISDDRWPSVTTRQPCNSGITQTIVLLSLLKIESLGSVRIALTNINVTAQGRKQNKKHKLE